MFKKISQVMCIYATVALMWATPTIFKVMHEDKPVDIIQPTKIEEVVEITETVEVPTQVYAAEQSAQEVKTVEHVEEIGGSSKGRPKEIVSDEEIELLALLTMAEAEGESEEGKRLVIDSVLNRVDSEVKYFPDTITEVIYQDGAYTSMWNGRVDRCYVSEEICQLVREELENRTNDDVVYFRTDHYSQYGTPLFVEGVHYFSSI